MVTKNFNEYLKKRLSEYARDEIDRKVKEEIQKLMEKPNKETTVIPFVPYKLSKL